MKHLTQELVAALGEISDLYPEWRFGQLVENVAAWAGVDGPASAWDVSDTDLLEAARQHLHQKQAGAATAHSD